MQTECFIPHNAVDALRAIKGNLLDPMNNLDNWNRGDPCTSNWTGVFCHKTNDAHLHVTELYEYYYLIFSTYLRIFFSVYSALFIVFS
jgi:hypothetical protein